MKKLFNLTLLVSLLFAGSLQAQFNAYKTILSKVSDSTATTPSGYGAIRYNTQGGKNKWQFDNGAGFVDFGSGGGGDMLLGTVQTNTAKKTFLDGTFALRNVADTYDAIFSNTNTANRTYTLPDASGTVALTSNIPVILNGGTLADFRTSGYSTGSSTFFGSNAGHNASAAYNSAFIGEEAGAGATNANESSFIGSYAGNGATDAGSSVMIGAYAGSGATDAQSSLMLGHNAGTFAPNASNAIIIGAGAGFAYFSDPSTGLANSILIGNDAGAKKATSINIGSDNIILGNSITLPDATNNGLNIGGIIFGTGVTTYNPLADPSFDPVGGKIGINVTDPYSMLDIAGDVFLRGENLHLNFGPDTVGYVGYGVRDTLGVMQYKDYGGSWTDFSSGGGGLTVGTSTITSGTNTRVLYNNSGVLGEYTVSGSGNVAMTTSPVFTTPALGTPSALVGTNITGTATGLTSGITNALKSATTTVDVSAATAPTSGQVLTATSGTAATWQTPSGGGGAWSLASGGTATGTNTFAMGSNPFILTSGVTTGTGATAGIQNVFNSLTTGNGLDISSSSVSSGAIVKITGTGTAAASNTQKGLWVDVSGANSTSTQTTYGGYFSNTHTGTSSKNIGLYAAASGGTNNFAIFADGYINLNNNQRLTWEANPSKAIWIQSNLMTLSNFGDFSFVTWGGASYAERFRISDTYTAIGGGTSATALRFLEPSGSGTNYSSFSAVAQSANINYSLPPTVAAAGAVLTDAAGNGVLTWEDKSLQSSTNTKTEKVIYNVGTIGSAATSTYSIHAESYYANGTTLLAKITVVAVKTDGSASAHSTVTARFRKNSSGTWSVDDAGTDITSDITILADVVGDFSTNPNVKVTMGAASGNYNVSWVAETIEVK